MGLPTRFHGDPKLDDPKLVREMCSICKQVREWSVDPQPDGSTIKTCKECGLKVLANAPKSDPPEEAKTPKRDEKGGLIEKIQKVITQIGNALK